MVKDKGEGEGIKPSLEATGVTEIQNDTVKAREAEAKDISPLRLDKKEVSLPSAKIRSRCRSHQIFGATKFGFSSSVVCHACAGLDFLSPVPSILARLLLEQVWGFGVPASSSLPPPVPSKLAWLLLEQD